MALTLAGGVVNHTLSVGNQGNKSFYYSDIPSDNNSTCDWCYHACYANNNCGNNVGGEARATYGCSVGDTNITYYACYNGCVDCVECYSKTYTYYACNSCNSACHSCNSNCHGSVGESFNIMYVHMWKRAG